MGAKGRMSHVRTVESCEFDSNVCESGEISRDVIVSVWPSNEYATAFLRRSQTLISLSMPPEYSSLPASESATAVIGNSVSIKSIACFCRGSQIYFGSVNTASVKPPIKLPTYPNVPIVRPTDQEFLSSFAHIHAVYNLFMSYMPTYSLARFEIPTR